MYFLPQALARGKKYINYFFKFLMDKSILSASLANTESNKVCHFSIHENILTFKYYLNLNFLVYEKNKIQMPCNGFYIGLPKFLCKAFGSERT